MSASFFVGTDVIYCKIHFYLECANKSYEKLNFVNSTLQNYNNLHFVAELFGSLNFFLYLCIGFEKQTIMKRTYFDNTNVSENFEETKTFLQDADPESVITDERVWNELSEIERTNWNDCLQELKNLFAGRKCIAYGTIGTWMGNRNGAKMFDDVKDAIASIVKDCEYITIESSDEGTIKVTASHHDGTHHMELKAVNAAGVRHADAWERKCDYNVSEYDMLERIWNSNIFSHKFTDKDILRG